MAQLRKLTIGAPPAGGRDEAEVRWLISYSDFMMQLVCLFILLYSVSSLDRGRMARVAASFRASIGEGELAASDVRRAGDKLAVGDRPLVAGDLGGGDLPAGLRYRLYPVPGGVRVEFDEPVFAPGSAAVEERAGRALEAVARGLRAYAGPVAVGASGDDAPGRDPRGLAAARAQAAVERLARSGLDARFLTARAQPGLKDRRIQIDLELR